jgi:hypothetical protein
MTLSQSQNGSSTYVDNNGITDIISDTQDILTDTATIMSGSGSDTADIKLYVHTYNGVIGV